MNLAFSKPAFWNSPGLRTLKLTTREVLCDVCLPEVADNAMLSLAAGLLGLGPVAAYGGRR